MCQSSHWIHWEMGFLTTWYIKFNKIYIIPKYGQDVPGNGSDKPHWILGYPIFRAPISRKLFQVCDEKLGGVGWLVYWEKERLDWFRILHVWLFDIYIYIICCIVIKLLAWIRITFLYNIWWIIIVLPGRQQPTRDVDHFCHNGWCTLIKTPKKALW